MEPGLLKPILTAFVMPPAFPLLVALLGTAIVLRRKTAGFAVTLCGIGMLWLLSCNGVAVLLASTLLPPFEPIGDARLKEVQAIVVLGGGIRPEAPEYGRAQPAPATLQRVRYAAALAKRSGKPIAISSGVGWGGTGASEAEVGGRVLAEEYGIPARWLEDRSRDTRENAQATAKLLLPQGVRRIALVTDETHMARSVRNFREAGFEVVPAPTAFVLPSRWPVLEWLPSTDGLAASRFILHEWLGLRLT